MFCLGTGKEITHYVIGYQELTFESVEMKIRDVKFKFLFIHFSFLFERETEISQPLAYSLNAPNNQS